MDRGSRVSGAERIEELVALLGDPSTQQLLVLANRGAERPKCAPTELGPDPDAYRRHDEAILEYLGACGRPASRPEIAQAIGLDRPARAWSRLLSRLEREGRIRGYGETSGRRYELAAAARATGSLTT